MHICKRIIAIFVVIMVVSSTLVVQAAKPEVKESQSNSFFAHPLVISFLEFFGISNTEKKETKVEKKKEAIPNEKKSPKKKKVKNAPEKKPKYGVEFSEIRERYPNKAFTKKVLTPNIEEYLNKVEAETGIPGAVIIAQAICEVGWDLSTPKSGNRDSYNLFNIKNCDGNYVVWGGCKYQCYDSYIDAIDAYVELITTLPRYSEAYQNIKKGGDFFTYFWMLGEAGYYEASKMLYSNSCVSIIQDNDLVIRQPIT